MKKGCLVVLVVGLLLVGGVFLVGELSMRGERHVAATAAPARVRVGDDATLTMGNGEQVMLCRTAAGLDEFYRLANAGDTLGIAQLVLGGRCSQLEDSTLVRIIGGGVGTREVRVLEGDAVGSSGWTAEEWLRAVEPTPAP